MKETCPLCNKVLKEVTEESPCIDCVYVHDELSTNKELDFDEDAPREYQEDVYDAVQREIQEEENAH